MKKFLVLVVIVLLGVGYYYGNKSTQADPVISSEVVVEPVVEAPTIVEPSTGFSFVPPVQPSINGTREENNKILWKHIADSSNQFSIAHANYVYVTLAREIRCDRDILIGINGKSMGVLHKNLNCQFMSDTQGDGWNLTMPLDNIQVIQNGEKKNLNLFDYVNDDWELNLSFAVGETDNYVTFIEVS